MSRQSSAGTEIVKIVVPLIILAGGAAGLLGFWMWHNKPASATTQKTDPTVKTVPIERHDDGVAIRVDGIAVPFREVALSAEVSGRVKKVTENCRAGKFVRAGDLLAEIDSSDYELEVQRLNAELGQAIAMLEQGDIELASTRQLVPLVRDELDLQQRQLDRLLKLGSGVSTETSIDEAKRSKLVAENALVKLEQQVQMLVKEQVRREHARDLAKSQLAKAELDLARCRVPAPVDGMVVSESVEQDSFVQKGTALATVEDTSSVEVKCNLMMEDLWWLWEQHDASQPRSASAGGDFEGGGFEPGAFQPTGLIPTGDGGSRDYQLPDVEVNVIWSLGGRDYLWKGRLDRYDGIGVNEKTRTVPCRVVVENPREVFEEVMAGNQRQVVPAHNGPPALVRGMFVELKILCRPRTPLVSLPEEAVRPGKELWLVRDGKLDFVKVQLAGIQDGKAIIDNGNGELREGEQAVVGTLAYAYEGMVVKPSPLDPAAGTKTSKSAASAAGVSRNRP